MIASVHLKLCSISHFLLTLFRNPSTFQTHGSNFESGLTSITNQHEIRNPRQYFQYLPHDIWIYSDTTNVEELRNISLNTYFTFDGFTILAEESKPISTNYTSPV